MANRLVYRQKDSNSDILVEYRNGTNPSNSKAIRVEPDGSVIDLSTSICYSDLDDWLSDLRR